MESERSGWEGVLSCRLQKLPLVGAQRPGSTLPYDGGLQSTGSAAIGAANFKRCTCSCRLRRLLIACCADVVITLRPT